MNYNKEIPRIINGVTIRERSDGRLEGRITVNGRTKSFYGKSKGNVREKVREYLAKIENGYLDNNVKFGDYMEHWLSVHAMHVDEQTIWCYNNMYSMFIKNTPLSRMKISDISVKYLQQLIDDYTSPRNPTDKALARGTIKDLKNLIKNCLNEAVREELIAKNPAMEVRIPNATAFKKKKKEREILSDEELIKFKQLCLMETTSKHATQKYVYKRGLVFLIMLNLGLRVGELLSLKWEDVHIEERYVYIKSTAHIRLREDEWVEGQSRYKIKDGTKTLSGTRYLGLNDDLIYYFNELKECQRQQGIETEFVCAADYNTLRLTLNHMIKRAGIDKHITPHCLRHTFGSTMIQKGVDIGTVSKLMGHSNISTTYNIYIHIIEKEKVKAMNTITVC